MLKENAAVLSRRWPALWNKLLAANLPAYEERGIRNATLQVGGLHLASAYDREAEARLQAARIPAGAKAATVYGVGLGDLPRLLAQRKVLEELHVVALNLGVVKLAFASADHSEWLAHPGVSLSYGGGHSQVSEPFSVVPPELQLADDAALRLRDAVMLKLLEPYLARNWQRRLESIEQQLKENLALVEQDADVRSLFGTPADEEIFVLAPGPTLEQEISRFDLRHATSVAVSTAVPTLVRLNVRPSFVVMIDADSMDVVPEKARKDYASIPLVYAAEVVRSTLERWPGPRFAAYLRRSRYEAMARALPRGSLWAQGTVAHSAVDLAVQMGATAVTMLGFDFSYPFGVSHTSENPDFHEHRRADPGRTVLNGLGQRIASDTNFIGYLRDLEAYIARHPHVIFRRAGRAGAAIEGAEWI